MSTSNDLTQRILDFLYRNEAYAWRAQSAGLFDRRLGTYRSAPKTGVSDILGITKGRFFGVEVKIGKDKLRDEQIGFIKNIEHHGGKVFIAKELEPFQEEFSQWLDTIK